MLRNDGVYVYVCVLWDQFSTSSMSEPWIFTGVCMVVFFPEVHLMFKNSWLRLHQSTKSTMNDHSTLL